MYNFNFSREQIYKIKKILTELKPLLALKAVNLLVYDNMYILTVFLLIFITPPPIQLMNYRRVQFGYTPNFTYPYTSQVKVQSITNFENKLIVYNCTGTAITDLVVLTVAHCIYKHDSVQVGYGSFRASRLKFISAIYWTVHPDYLSTTVKSVDLGLILLGDSIRFTDSIRPIRPRFVLENERGSDLQDVTNVNTTLCGKFTAGKSFRNSVKIII